MRISGPVRLPVRTADNSLFEPLHIDLQEVDLDVRWDVLSAHRGQSPHGKIDLRAQKPILGEIATESLIHGFGRRELAPGNDGEANRAFALTHHQLEIDIARTRTLEQLVILRRRLDIDTGPPLL